MRVNQEGSLSFYGEVAFMVSDLKIEIVRVVSDTDLQAVFSVRMQVFVIEQNVPSDEELDSYDATAVHLLAMINSSDRDSKIVGTARLLDKGNRLAKIGRVAVLKEFRGLGVGTELMNAAEYAAAEQGFIEILLEAQVHAIPFYEKLGYFAKGAIFLDANIEHRLMRKSISSKMPSPDCGIERLVN